MSLHDEKKRKPSVSVYRAAALETELSKTRTRNRLQKLRELKAIRRRLAELKQATVNTFSRASGQKATAATKTTPDTTPKLPGAGAYRPVALPVSKKQIDDLHEKLSKPAPDLTLTPTGPGIRQLKTEQDKAILREIEVIRARLELRRNRLKESFARNNRPPASPGIPGSPGSPGKRSGPKR